MEILRFGKGNKDLMVRVTPDEALALIASLSRQILTRNANAEREEFHIGSEYFSIAVHHNLQKGSR